jgi:ATP-binding cassette, subfamily C (CFTR/MRP), member 1
MSGSLCSLLKGAISVYASLQLAVLVLWSTNSYFITRLSIASAAVNVLVALGLALLSHLEHVKSIRPSFIITFYLLASLIFDVARVRTQWLLWASDTVAAVLTSSVAVKLVMLVLEAVEKRRILLATYHDLSPEITSGIFSRGLFWWLNPLLVNGFKRILSVNDLFPINEKLASDRLSEDLQARWNRCEAFRLFITSQSMLVLSRLTVFRQSTEETCTPARSVDEFALGCSCYRVPETLCGCTEHLPTIPD